MRTALRKIGNSAGVVLPSALLGRAGLALGAEMDVSMDGERVVLTPVRKVREGWAEAAAAIGQEEDPELNDWLNCPNEADDEWEW